MSIIHQFNHGKQLLERSIDAEQDLDIREELIKLKGAEIDAVPERQCPEKAENVV
ncbi:hypothetical protein [Pseudomonas sp. Irchel 3F3]|uniref:hypothetical protein n=1 Tax=Pseudomonas sp. Irchel 3F3 TaxID=2009000 RepID=UPI00135B1CAE|nr:hypothetical protein [Pseudomonas sp. Irchel 3F3]